MAVHPERTCRHGKMERKVSKSVAVHRNAIFHVIVAVQVAAVLGGGRGLSSLSFLKAVVHKAVVHMSGVF